MIEAIKAGISHGLTWIGAVGTFIIGLVLVGVLVEVVELVGRLFKAACRKNEKKSD